MVFRILGGIIHEAVHFCAVKPSNMLISFFFSSKARSRTTSAVFNGAEDFGDVLHLMYLALVPYETKRIRESLLFLAIRSFALVRPVMSIHMPSIEPVSNNV